MPNFSRLMPASNVLTAELWISFAALLRSHVAMRSIAESNANWQIVSNAPSNLEVRGWNRWLRVTAPVGSQAGIVDWLTVKNERQERFATFSFVEDGQVCFNSLISSVEADGTGMTEMEAAVEFLLDALRDRRRA